MANQYIRDLRIQKRSVIKRLYAAVCMVLVTALLVSTTSYAWLVLSQVPEVTDVSTTLGANGNLEIALNTNSLDTYIFTANEDTSMGIESIFEKNSYWGNVVDLSDERYGLQNIQLKPAALNYKSDAELAVNMGAPFLIAQYDLDGRATGLSSSSVLTSFDSETNKFISSANYGVRALGEASKAFNTLTIDTNQDDAVLAVYNAYRAIADANSPEVPNQEWSAWREAIWNVLLRIYFKHSDAIASGTTASESYTAATIDELETQYLMMQENINNAYTYLRAMVICRVFADGNSPVAQAKITNLLSTNENNVREYFVAAGITDYNKALDLLDETRNACNGVLNAISSFKTTSAYTSGNITYAQIRNLLLSDLDLNNITFNGNSIGTYDIASYAANQYAYCLLNKTTTLDYLYGNDSYNFSIGSGLNFMSALEFIHTVAQHEYAGKLYYSGYTMTIPSYANNEEIRGMTYKTFMNPYNGYLHHLSWAYPYLTDSSNRGTTTNTEYYKQAYANAKTALLEAFYIPEDPDYSAFITPAFDHIISVANGDADTYSYEYLARLKAGLDTLSADFLNQYGEGIKYYALMFAALISDAEYAEGTSITKPATDSLYSQVLQAINDGKSADEVLAISGYLDYEYNVGNPPNNYYFKKMIGDPYAYMKTAITNAYAQIEALEASKSTGEALTWEEIYSIIVYIIGEDFAPYNGEQVEYANDRANCSIVLDVRSKAIGNIHTLFNNQNHACDFTLSELDISADSYDSFMNRLITENAGILPEKMTYGVCIYRWDIPEYRQGNLEPSANGTTYAFGIDLLFRTNASTANLLLQTIGIDRIYNNDNAPGDWMYSEKWEAAQGQGSQITMDHPELLAALRVAFVDTSTGELYGIAKADSNGYLYLSNDDGSATIRPLTQNTIAAITVWVYLDGNIVSNLHADTAAATDMKVNLQFATDATLNPAFGGNAETSDDGTIPPATDENKSGTWGDNLTWSYTTDGTLRISGTGEMKSTDAYTYPWSEFSNRVTNIVIEDGVTSTAFSAFKTFSKLERVSFGKDVNTVGLYTFYNCTNLVEVILPIGLESIEDSAFFGCESIKEITLPFNLVHIGNSAFYSCKRLNNIIIPKGITTIEDRTFRYCYGLENVYIPEEVTSIGDYAFEGCSSLTNVVIPEGVTSIGEQAFFNCITLDHIVIPESVTHISKWAFGGCRKLEELVDGVYYVGRWAVDYDEGITKASLRDNTIGISAEAFRESELTNIEISDSVKYINRAAFSECGALKEIIIPNGVTVIAKWEFVNCTNLESITLPTSITTIEDLAFHLCNSLNHIYYKGSEAQWNNINISTESYEFPDSITIHFATE